MFMICRFYHVSSVVYNYKKLGAKLCKMVSPNSKRNWYPAQIPELNAMPTVKSLTKIKYEPGKRAIRRIGMLNKIFMKQITDLMSTGTVAMDIVGQGIEISKVKVMPDYNTVNVFWVCKGECTDKETEALLNQVAGALRHELSTLRVMGEIPYIIFVKDKQESNLVDLDKRLAEADYGEDYEPTELGHLLKSEFTLDTKLSPEIKAKIKQLEEETLPTEAPLPEMGHSVYGLDHAKIMNRLMVARKKSKDAWANLDTENTVISYKAIPSQTEPVDTLAQKTELADFLLQRKIQRENLHKKLLADQRLNNVMQEDDDVDDEEWYTDDDDYYPDEYDWDHDRSGGQEEGDAKPKFS